MAIVRSPKTTVMTSHAELSYCLYFCTWPLLCLTNIKLLIVQIFRTITFTFKAVYGENGEQNGQICVQHRDVSPEISKRGVNSIHLSMSLPLSTWRLSNLPFLVAWKKFKTLNPFSLALTRFHATGVDFFYYNTPRRSAIKVTTLWM